MKKRQHPDCYPGTEVLINKRGYRTQEQLEEAERLMSASRLGTLAEHPITPNGLRGIHKHLFEQLYDWAGKYRMVTTGRGRLSFCKAEYIENEVEKRFAAINREGNLVGLSAASFAERAAEHINELNAIHPFLDGNGRTQRALLVTLGRTAGHAIDLALVDPAAWNKASELGFYALDNAPMTKVIRGAIVRERGGIEVDDTTPLDGRQDEKNHSKNPTLPAEPEDNSKEPKGTKLFVTRLELESSLSDISQTPRSPVVRLLTEGMESVRFLTHRKTLTGCEPNTWVAGAEALNALLHCFGSGKYRSLHIDTATAKTDGGRNQIKALLADAVASTKGRTNSIHAATSTRKDNSQSLGR